jgi:stage III sporulation protein AF
MLDFIENWIMGVTAAAMIAAIAQALTPEGSVKKAMRLACGVLMILAVLRPVKEISLEDFSFYKTRYEEGLSEYSEKMNDVNKSFTRSIIEEKTATYILEKADELQIACSVSVKLKTDQSGGYPYPYSVELTVSGYPENEKKEALSRLIESQCAIPKDRQKWVVEG